MYPWFYRTILFPFYEHLVRGRGTVGYIKELEASQWLPYTEITKIQWLGIERLLRHAWENVPYYRRTMEGIGITSDDIRTFEDFRKLPTVDKETIRKNYYDLIAKNYLNCILNKSTGGSTGEPLHFAYTRESYERRIAAAARGYGWAGCWDGERTFYVWGVPIGREPYFTRLKKSLHNAILRRRIFNCFAFSEEKMEACLREMTRFRPAFIVGYTNPLYNLAQFTKKTGFRPFKPRAVLTGAEKLFSYQRSSIEDVFQCPVFETYGSREFMLIASECDKHNGLHLSAENLYVEFLKDGKPVKDGELGEIVVTDLHNYGMPFIRYRIGDLGVPASGQCPCDRGLPLVERIKGRLLDTIQTPDGRFVPGEFFPHLMKEFPDISKFQVVQEQLGLLNIALVTDGKFTTETQNFLLTEIRKVLGEEIKIEFNLVTDIPVTGSGKFRVVVSKVPINLGN